MSKKRRVMPVKPLVDLASVIEQAEKETGKPIVPVQVADNYVVGISVKAPDGQLTCSATKHFNVDVLIGPSNIGRKYDSLEEFAKDVHVLKMHFSPFSFDKAGHISRGSLTLPPTWVGVCTECGKQVKSNTLLRQSRGSKSTVCKRCGAKNSFKRKSTRKSATIETAGIWELFKTYSAGYENGDKLSMPRAWALYREGNTPTAWVPEVSDDKAMSLAIKANYSGMEIRPAQHAIMSQSKATASFVLESTAGFSSGWLKKSELMGGTIKSCGYKFQAGSIFHGRKVSL